MSFNPNVADPFQPDPFLKLTETTVPDGQVHFSHLLGDMRDGVWARMGRHAAFFEIGNVARLGSDATTLINQSPHPVKLRQGVDWWREQAVTTLYGGGDVYANRHVTGDKPEVLLLSAGAGRVAEIIDIGKVLEVTGTAFDFLHTSYLASTDNVEFHTHPCGPARMLWAASLNVYRVKNKPQDGKPATLCLSGAGAIWREVIPPKDPQGNLVGEVMLRPGRVVGLSDNLEVALVPTVNHQGPVDPTTGLQWSTIDPSVRGKHLRQIASLQRTARTLFDSAVANEGPVALRIYNPTDRPGLLVGCLHPMDLYTGSGIVGWVTRNAMKLTPLRALVPS